MKDTNSIQFGPLSCMFEDEYDKDLAHENNNSSKEKVEKDHIHQKDGKQTQTTPVKWPTTYPVV